MSEGLDAFWLDAKNHVSTLSEDMIGRERKFMHTSLINYAMIGLASRYEYSWPQNIILVLFENFLSILIIFLFLIIFNDYHNYNVTF